MSRSLCCSTPECDAGHIPSDGKADKYAYHPMCRRALMAHTDLMFQHHQLTAAIRADRQTRLRNAARLQRLLRHNKVPPAASSDFFSVVWPDGDGIPRAHCVA